MKQKTENVIFALPKRIPKTVGGLSRWNRELLDLCLLFEFKKRALEAALEKVNEEIRQYVPYTRNAGATERPARAALSALNRVKAELRSQIETIREVVRVVHDSNEVIVGSILRCSVPRDVSEEILARHHPETNLLHGHGWLQEVASAEVLREQGYAPFVTFGTVLDPCGVDVVALAKPKARVKWSPAVLRRYHRLRRLNRRTK